MGNSALSSAITRSAWSRPSNWAREASTGSSGLPGQRGVAAGVDEALGPDRDVAVTRGQFDLGDPAVVEVRSLEHGAEDGPDAEAPDRLLQPAAEGHLVVEDGRGVAALEVQVTGRAEV
ncbi:MAG TPA: hypothetical protein VFQ68_43635, partial [Streptosporangiaceae bacterium]|nr:hypothetical protein [Streptosporangiaceae bacterium]